MTKVKLRDAQEIDVIVDCSCGASFRVYLPDCPYECPDCHSIYEVYLSVKKVERDDNQWKMVGHKI